MHAPESPVFTHSSSLITDVPGVACLGDTNEIVRLFTLLGLAPPDTKDTFSISYVNGILSVDIARSKSPSIEAGVYLRIGMGFSGFRPFKPKAMLKKDRNKMMQEFCSRCLSQKKISEIFGVTQQTVSNICRAAAHMEPRNILIGEK